MSKAKLVRSALEAIMKRTGAKSVKEVLDAVKKSGKKQGDTLDYKKLKKEYRDKNVKEGPTLDYTKTKKKKAPRELDYGKMKKDKEAPRELDYKKLKEEMRKKNK